MLVFDRIIEDALQKLGQGMKESILFHYYRYQSSTPAEGVEPEKFHRFLHEVFGHGAFVIEDIIIKCVDSVEFNIQDRGPLLMVKKIFTCSQ